MKYTGKPYAKKRKSWRLPLIGVGTLFALAMCGLILIPATMPSMAGTGADMLRSAIGPQLVAQLESVSFGIQDAINQYRYRASGDQPQITWNTPPQPVVPKPGLALSAVQFPDQSPKSTAVPTVPTAAVMPTTISSTPSVSSTPVPSPSDPSSTLNWQPYGQVVNGKVVMERTLVATDPTRPYAGVALIRMDLSQLQLNMMPGTKEPLPLTFMPRPIPNQGMVPPSQWNVLVAAFNGGFKAIHGHYGMMVDNMTLQAPTDRMATVAIYKDGTVRIGAWGTDIAPSPDIIAYRQNCPPLIENGQLTSYVYNSSRQLWGLTLTADATWRTGLGITQDGRYLLYAVGNGTTATSLAKALQAGGAYWAMQLDINSGYQHFMTYQTSSPGAGLSLTAQPLLSQMTNDPSMYLTPNQRDFFYMTAKQ